MALRADYESTPGLVAADAYIMVESVWIHAKHKSAEIFVAVYSSEDLRRAGSQVTLTPDGRSLRFFADHAQYDEFFTPEALSQHGSNPIASAYAFLIKYSGIQAGLFKIPENWAEAKAI